MRKMVRPKLGLVTMRSRKQASKTYYEIEKVLLSNISFKLTRELKPITGFYLKFKIKLVIKQELTEENIIPNS